MDFRAQQHFCLFSPHGPLTAEFHLGVPHNRGLYRSLTDSPAAGHKRIIEPYYNRGAQTSRYGQRCRPSPLRPATCRGDRRRIESEVQVRCRASISTASAGRDRQQRARTRGGRDEDSLCGCGGRGEHRRRAMCKGGWQRRRRREREHVRMGFVPCILRGKQQRETLCSLGLIRIHDASRVGIWGDAQAGNSVRAGPAVHELHQRDFRFDRERERAVSRVMHALLVGDAEGVSGGRGWRRGRRPRWTRRGLPVGRRRFHGRAGTLARAQETHESLSLCWGRRRCMNGGRTFSWARCGVESEFHIDVIAVEVGWEVRWWQTRCGGAWRFWQLNDGGCVA